MLWQQKQSAVTDLTAATALLIGPKNGKKGEQKKDLSSREDGEGGPSPKECMGGGEK